MPKLETLRLRSGQARKSEFVALMGAVLLAAPLAAQLWLTHGEASEFEGEPAVRFQVWHQHGMKWCSGHLYFTRAQVAYQVLGPPNYAGDSFSQPREKVRLELRGSQKVSGGRWSIGPLRAPSGQAFRLQTDFGRVKSGRRYDFFLASGISADGNARLDSVSLLPLQEAWENFDLALEHARAGAKRTPPSAPVPGPVKTANLQIEAQPGGAEFYVDDQFRGTTSGEGRLTVADLPPGEHRLRLTRKGYQEWGRAVTLTAGETRTVEVQLAEAIPETALKLEDVVKLLEAGVTPARLETIVRERGVAFELTAEAERKLREAGATAELLLAIAKGKR